MLFLSDVSLLVALFCSNVLSKEIALNHDLAGRQIFASLTYCTGADCPQTSSTSSKSSSGITSSSVISSSSSITSSASVVLTTSSAISSSPSPSSGISSVVSSTSTTSSVSYDPYALTTTFTQPPACTGGFTAIKDWGTEIYNNIILYSTGYNFTYTSCFPPQFYSSVLASTDPTALPPFTALICPSTWEGYDINSTYVICCPNGYGFVAPNYDDPIRPGAGAVCSSYIGGGALMDITTYDLTGGETVVPMTAGPNGTVVWAIAFDGITTSVSVASTSTSPSLSTATTSPISTSSSSSLLTTTPSTASTSTKIISSTPTTSSSQSTTTKATTLSSSTSSLTTTTGTAVPGESALPACGILCFDNMLAQYSTLGCNQFDSYCLCNNVNFSYGLRDCSNGACGAAVASTVIAFGSSYCSTATATHRAQITAAR